LRIDIRYRQYVYEPSVSLCPYRYLRRVIRRRDPRNGESDIDISSSSGSESESESESEPSVSLGSEFDYGEGVYCVVGIDRAASQVTSKCTYPLGGGNVTLSLDNVMQAIRDRLM
jgi:hypothetical protein